MRINERVAIEDLRAARSGKFNTRFSRPEQSNRAAIGRKKESCAMDECTSGISGVLHRARGTMGDLRMALNAGGTTTAASWPPFIIIGFELRVLIGGIFG